MVSTLTNLLYDQAYDYANVGAHGSAPSPVATISFIAPRVGSLSLATEIQPMYDYMGGIIGNQGGGFRPFRAGEFGGV